MNVIKFINGTFELSYGQTIPMPQITEFKFQSKKNSSSLMEGHFHIVFYYQIIFLALMFCRVCKLLYFSVYKTNLLICCSFDPSLTLFICRPLRTKFFFPSILVIQPIEIWRLRQPTHRHGGCRISF